MNDSAVETPTSTAAAAPRGAATHRDARRLRACLLVTAGYLVVVVLVLLVRLELHKWGFLLRDYERATLWSVLWMHLGALFPAGGLYGISRFVRRCSPLWPRFALAVLPLVVLVSCDRLATIHVEPIRERMAMFRHHSRRGWTLNPRWADTDTRVFVRVNRHGFRGPDLPLEKAGDEFRVLFLGDSVPFGWGVEEEEGLVDQFERYAAERLGARRLSTVNAAVPAYSTWQEYDLLVHDALQFAPDVIVLVFCLNDVLDKFKLLRFGGWTLGFEPERPGPLEWSGLYRLIRHLRAEVFRPSGRELREWEYSISVHRLLREPDAAKVKEGWAFTKEQLEKIVQTAGERGIPLMMVCAPAIMQLLEEEEFPPPSPQAVLRDFARAHDVPYLDLLPVLQRSLRSSGGRAWDLFLDKVHFSPEGNAIVAEAIWRSLQEHDLVKTAVRREADGVQR